MSKYVRTKVGVPQLSDFADAEGTPLVVDVTTGAIYFVYKNNVRALIADGGATGATNLSVINVTADGLTVASDTGADAVLPASTASTAGVATAAQVALIETAVQPARAIVAGAGLTGGGNLSADRTLAADFGTTTGKVCQGDDGRLSDARTPTAHTHTEANISDLDRLRFKGMWNATLTYAKNDTVIDGPYITIAKTATTDKPAPVFTQAEPGWILPSDAGIWTETLGPRWFGHRYGPLIGDTLAQGVRFRTVTAGLIQYAYLMVNGAGRFDVAKNLATPANAWVEVRFPPFVLRLNDVVDLVVYVDGTHNYAQGPNEWPQGGTVKSFSYANPSYPPTSFWVTQFGADVLIQSGTMSANWSILCKSA